MGGPRGIPHGALDHAELAAAGLSPEDVLDFSSNLNPFGPPAGVRAALAALDPAPYPDRSSYRLRLLLAARHGWDPDAILVGNGANELIHLVARALLGPGAGALIVGPTFGEYAHACRLAGAAVAEVRAGADEAFRISPQALEAAIRRERPRLTWLCAPNNPTGVDLPAPAIGALCATCRDHGGLLVVDRAYHELRRGPPAGGDAPARPPASLIQLHALTKSYALAGLRLGYMLAEAPVVALVAEHQPAWSVSSAAQAAGLAALADAAFLPTTLPQLWEASDALCGDLRALGLDVRRGALPFMLVRVSDAAAVRAALLARGCVVRDCASFGLPGWVRVAPRRPEQNARLVAAWKEIR